MTYDQFAAILFAVLLTFSSTVAAFAYRASGVRADRAATVRFHRDAIATLQRLRDSLDRPDLERLLQQLSDLDPLAVAAAAAAGKVVNTAHVPLRAAGPLIRYVNMTGIVVRGASKASIRDAVNVTALNECYAAALRNGFVQVTRVISAQLKLTMSNDGRVISAALDAPMLPTDLRSCIEKVARSGHVRKADAVATSAMITLSFETW